MAAHQHEGMDGAVMLERGFAQFLQVLSVIHIGSEAGLTVVAALHDVLRDAGQIKSWLSGHGGVC